MGKIYCSQCGVQLDDSAKFCTNCGSKIATTDLSTQVNDSNNKHVPLWHMILFYIFIGIIFAFLVWGYGWGLLIYEILVVVILILYHMFNNTN